MKHTSAQKLTDKEMFRDYHNKLQRQITNYNHLHSNVFSVILPFGLSSIIVPVGIYLLKSNNRNTRTRCGICSKLTI